MAIIDDMKAHKDPYLWTTYAHETKYEIPEKEPIRYDYDRGNAAANLIVVCLVALALFGCIGLPMLILADNANQDAIAEALLHECPRCHNSFHKSQLVHIDQTIWRGSGNYLCPVCQGDGIKVYIDVTS